MTKWNIHFFTKQGRQLFSALRYSAAILVLSNVYPLIAWAEESHVHPPQTQFDQRRVNALVKVVRESTERFKDVAEAEAEGYALQFGCVSGPDSGAMGLHYVNGALVQAGVLDATKPQIVIYEAGPKGNLKLIGADYLLLAEPWDKAHSSPPELMGQMFHYWESPNRFGLPAFYTLHVWAWKENPNGAFVNWHPNVSCQSFSEQEK